MLVVDDDRDTRELVGLVLRLEGYAVVRAADGAAALDLARRRRPGLILLDMRMPGMGGPAFARARRGLPPPRPPLVLLTAAAEARDSADLSGAEILLKPFDVERLVRVVARYLAPGHHNLPPAERAGRPPSAPGPSLAPRGLN